jgi:hypothetical protein
LGGTEEKSSAEHIPISKNWSKGHRLCKEVLRVNSKESRHQNSLSKKTINQVHINNDEDHHPQ